MTIQKRKIYIAGHNGMVGSAICRKLTKNPNVHLIVKSREELDLLNQERVRVFFETEKPDEVYLAAARVGGILANNDFPAEFIYENLMIEANIIHSAWLSGVKKLLFLGSSCIYPKFAAQPMDEDALLTGYLEPTNEPYAIAKIAGIKLCESYNRQYAVDYRSVMPTNLYGPGDNYHGANSHVIPALIKKFHDAKVNGDKEVLIWGSGSPRREFLYVDDMARASIFVMDLSRDRYNEEVQPMQSHLNVGSGSDITIKDLAHEIAKVTSYDGAIKLDSSMPDGAPRKLMKNLKLTKLGWQPEVDLDQGLALAYADFCNNDVRLK
jgi:GDP-L-fucose synthase